MKLKTFFGDLVYGILAGICISIGGMVFLSLDDKVLGAVFFSIGLLAVLNFKFNLYTGKIGYLVKNIKEKTLSGFIPMVVATILGNLIGTYGCGILLRVTRIYPAVSEKAEKLVSVKCTDSCLSLFVLAVFCGILMYIAVDTFNTKGSQLVVVFAVAVFILIGAEHSIADMFYFAVSGHYFEAVPLVVIILGNLVGCNLIPMFKLSK